MDKNFTEIVGGIKEIAFGILEEDITIVKGFSQRQMDNLAKQTVIVQTNIANGKYSEKQKEFFLNELELMALNFVNTLKGVLLVTIEKLWNALVTFLYKVVGVVT
ncbi:hypothetical protein [Aequorivita marina]|uniref:hypothetical protein n=1 Tax=Aequorivita marina TaxID=3073654 RepID=UPI0028771876|nr:hypothetical protein [Aequorivita sp. S2608]MDS1298444.1 hypothetical protein [Aequorivita sp. S2608]